MSDTRPIDDFRTVVRQWTWEDLRKGISSLDRFSDAELAVIREECARRSESRDSKGFRRAHVRCQRCDIVLVFAGTKKFHEGFQWGILGDLAELFENRERFDVYFCPRCGRIEFFVDGVGEDLRPQ